MKPRSGFSSKLGSNWFLLTLVAVVTGGTFLHAQLESLTKIPGLQSSIVFGVMWLMAAPVPFSMVRNTLARPLPGILASLINLGLIPLLTLAIAPWLRPDLGGGLLVAATVPSTLASAAVWTRKAGGDDTVAILVTLVTNISCVLVTPLWLGALLGKQVQLDLPTLMTTLLIIVVLPIALAQLMRLSNRLCSAVDQHKSEISVICQVGILAMVLLGSVQMGVRLAESPHDFGNNWIAILFATVAACGIHLTALAIAWWLSVALRIDRPQRIAVSLSGSQKTLMIGLKLAIDCGVSILPMVIYHVSQLLMDAVIVKHWAKSSAPTVSSESPTASASQGESGPKVDARRDA